MHDIPRNLKTARLLAGMTLQEVAARTGISYVQIGRLERGERRLYVHDMIKIAHALGVEPTELLKGHQNNDRAA